jgi:hypothetical protein
MKMARRPGMARRKGHGSKGQNIDDVAPRTPKGRTFEQRCWKDPECNNGIRDRPETAVTKQDGIHQDLHEYHRAKDRETNSRIFCRVTKD